jgi:superfamily I DNA and RNA helicase
VLPSENARQSQLARRTLSVNRRLAHGLQRLVLLESVYRFKGQAAPAIIFAEIDFDVLDEKAVRKLFVGATRSMMKLVLVLHETAASQLLGRMD